MNGVRKVRLLSLLRSDILRYSYLSLFPGYSGLPDILSHRRYVRPVGLRLLCNRQHVSSLHRAQPRLRCCLSAVTVLGLLSVYRYHGYGGRCWAHRVYIESLPDYSREMSQGLFVDSLHLKGYCSDGSVKDTPDLRPSSV